MADLTPLFDVLAGAGGHPVNRPALNAYVANSQAANGLRSAQTDEALGKAQQMQDEVTASGQLESALGDYFGGTPAAKSKAKAAATIMRGHFGNSSEALDALLKNQQLDNRGTLSDPNQLGSAAQTAAQQGVQGKVATPYNVPQEFGVLPGAVQPNVQQTPQGVAHTAQTNAVTTEDLARAEEAHAKATKAVTGATSSLSPDSVDAGSLVVMADPSKMSGYATFGQQGQANRDAINNRVSERLTQAGMSPQDMIRQRALAKASVGGAGQAAKQLQTIDAFAPLVKSNGDRVNQLLSQVHDDAGDLPVAAGLERALGRHLGDNDLAELHSVFSSYQAEIARLLAAGPSMNGVISDHARDKVASMAPENMTTNQARQVINRIDTEIGIRRAGVAGSLDNATAAQQPVVSAPQGAGGPGTVAPAGPVTVTPSATGQTPAGGGKVMPDANKLKAYADAHFGGDLNQAHDFLQKAGYQ